MNAKLLTAAEKLRNRRERQRRNAVQKARKRRAEVVAGVSHPFAVALPSVIDGAGCCDLLWGGLKSAKKVTRALQRTTLAAVPGSDRRRLQGANLACIPRPLRTLWPRHRSKLVRLAGAPAPLEGEYMGIDRALVRARELIDVGVSGPRVLEFLCAPQVIGLPEPDCAEILYRAGILHERIAAADILAVNAIHEFGVRIEEGRAAYNAMAVLKQIPPASGEWIFFTRAGLFSALPGLHLPGKLVRDEFLVRVMRDAMGEPECLDLHSILYHDLVRHPVAKIQTA